MQQADKMYPTSPRKLLIIWSSQDLDVALNLVFMYGGNALAKDWWEEVCLIIWGPSQKLLIAEPRLQSEIARLQDNGVDLVGCRACADRYNLVAELEAMGLTVEHVGERLTRLLQHPDWKSLSF